MIDLWPARGRLIDPRDTRDLVAEAIDEYRANLAQPIPNPPQDDQQKEHP